MPEGQVSHRNAVVLTDAIAGSPITAIDVPEPRLGPQRIADRLAGDVLDHMEARGKHHLFHFASGRTLHSHLQMNGRWRAFAPGAHIPRTGLWLALTTDQGAVAQYRGPVLRLYEPGARIPRLDAVGPDLLDDTADPAATAQRLLALPPARELGDALMDQRVMSGIGNVYKSETLFLAGLDPWRPIASLTPEEASAIGRIAAHLLARGVRDGGRITTYPLEARGDDGLHIDWDQPAASGHRVTTGGRRPDVHAQTTEPRIGVRPSGEEVRIPRIGGPSRAGGTWVYGRGRRECRRCGTRVRGRGQGDANRTTYWCPSCQR